MRLATGLLLAVWLAAVVAPQSVVAKPMRASGFTESRSIHWPAGSELVPFENLDGLALVRCRLTGLIGRDTTGPFALDTGAGHLAIDRQLAQILGLADSTITDVAIGVASHPLPRFQLGGWVMDQVEPILTVDASVVERVSDRPVLGLIGQRPLRDRAVWIDYREQVVVFIPQPPIPTSVVVYKGTSGERGGSKDSLAGHFADPTLARSRAWLGDVLTARAVPVDFELLGDGKIFVHGTLSDPRPPSVSDELNLLVDTGATKCVLFDGPLRDAVRHSDAWPALRGFTAPTLIGTSDARIARVPMVEIVSVAGRLRAPNVDIGVVGNELGNVLSQATGQTIHGLIGYSFLKRYRVVIDYPHQVLWLDPIPDYRDDRPFEYCHVGIQIERQDGAVIVAGVVAGSPAARGGIQVGDELTAIDGVPARPLDLVALTRRLEGKPGSRVTLEIRRDDVDHAYPLVRRRLL